uniref:Capsid protein n=1 Tax=Gorilla anellovirus TaxID=1743411 RepID=A0A0S2GMG2_9VIRU|nr:ORF1 [Gorilla anellovirus]
MPYYWQRNFRWRRNWRRRLNPYTRRRLRLWRFRNPIRQRRRHRRRVRKRKLKYLTLRQWQPKTIRNCKIKGLICLFQAGHERFSNNWGQYQASYVPEHWPGGGGWSLLVFSLGALYQEFQLLRNWWTTSNRGLPLVRYLGCSFKFYQSEHTDYVATYTTCYPMTDTKYMHANAQPSRMLMSYQKVIVPCKKTNPKRKGYIKKYIKPPKQMLNKWFFQKGMCNTGLVLLTTTACSLDQYYLSNNNISNNITLCSLNTTPFTHKAFQQDITTKPFTPKPSFYLIGSKNGEQKLKYKDLIILGNTHDYTDGHTFSEVIGRTTGKFTSQDVTKYMKKENWGNPFYSEFLKESQRVWITNTDPLKDFNRELTSEVQNITELSNPIVVKCRYNPNKDTGEGNIAYFLKNTKEENGWRAPTGEDLYIDGFPLWILLFGWADWQKKLAIQQQIDINYMLVVQTPFISPPLPYYVFLDNNFIDGLGPHGQQRTPSDSAHWYPKFLYQQSTVNAICISGPGSPKGEGVKSIQAKMEYTFRFKWGGCPAPMENITDPCQQSIFPVPDKINQRLQIQSPELCPTTNLYSWDERRQTITKTAAKRLKTDSELTKFMLTDGTTTSRPTMDPPTTPFPKEEKIIQEILENSSEEETETPLSQQLQHHRNQHRKLKFRLLQLIYQLKSSTS